MYKQQTDSSPYTPITMFGEEDNEKAQHHHRSGGSPLV